MTEYDLISTGCPMCGKNGGRPFSRFQAINEVKDMLLCECPSCRSVYVNPRPSSQEVVKFFSSEHLYEKSLDPEGKARSLLRERDRRFREYNWYVKQLRQYVHQGRMLDVGAGLGLFLELMGPDFDRVGVEINPLAARYVRKNLDIDLREGDILDMDFKPASFDLVSVMQTLDHLDRPGAFLSRALEWLKPGGLLFISALININSLCARIYGQDFRLLHPFHLVYFKPHCLRAYLEKIGLGIVRMEYPYFRTPYFHFRDFIQTPGKLLRRVISPPRKNVPRPPSPPFPGNILNVYARKPVNS